MVDLHRVEMEINGTSPFADSFAVAYDLRDWQGAGDAAVDEFGTKDAPTPGTRGNKVMTPMFSGPAANRFLVTAETVYSLDSNTQKRISMRFTARVSTTAGTMHLYTAFYNSGGYTMALYQDNGAGEPGTQLCLDPVPTMVNNGWSEGVCGAAVTGGTIYHLAMWRTSGGGSARADVRYTTPNNLMHAFDGSTDPDTDVLLTSNGGSMWNEQGAQPVFALAGSPSLGNPYHTFTTLTVSSANGYGNKFTLGGAESFTQAEFYVSRRSSVSPGGNLVLKICNVVGSGCGSILLTVNVPHTSVPLNPTYAWIPFNFAPLSLSGGVQYAIWIESDWSTQSYQTYANIASTTLDPQGPTTFDGLTTFRVDVSTGGPTFGDQTPQDIPFTLVPEFSDAAVPAILAFGMLGLARRLRRRAVK
jgi:hypothetical protein